MTTIKITTIFLLLFSLTVYSCAKHPLKNYPVIPVSVVKFDDGIVVINKGNVDFTNVSLRIDGGYWLKIKEVKSKGIATVLYSDFKDKADKYFSGAGSKSVMIWADGFTGTEL